MLFVLLTEDDNDADATATSSSFASLKFRMV